MSPDAAVTDAQPPSPPARSALWAGRVLSALPILAMTMSALMKFAQKPEMLQMFTGKFGYPAGALLPIAVAELLCVVLYAIPQTAVLGAILMTGYLGGAIATHVRVSEHFIPPLLLGILAWAGLYLRDPRLRALLPLRAPATPSI